MSLINRAREEGLSMASAFSTSMLGSSGPTAVKFTPIANEVALLAIRTAKSVYNTVNPQITNMLNNTHGLKLHVEDAPLALTEDSPPMLVFSYRGPQGTSKDAQLPATGVYKWWYVEYMEGQ